MLSLEQLLAKSIPELKERFVDRARPVPKGLVGALESDSRQGAGDAAVQNRGNNNKVAHSGGTLTDLSGAKISTAA